MYRSIQSSRISICIKMAILFLHCLVLIAVTDWLIAVNSWNLINIQNGMGFVGDNFTITVFTTLESQCWLCICLNLVHFKGKFCFSLMSGLQFYTKIYMLHVMYSHLETWTCDFLATLFLELRWVFSRIFAKFYDKYKKFSEIIRWIYDKFLKYFRK